MILSFFKFKNKIVKDLNRNNKIKKVYTEEFNEFLKFANKTLIEFNLKDWSISIDHSKRRAGACFYNTQILSFSKTYLRKAEKKDIKDTLLHEIAHALVGPGNAHNSIWKNKAIEIGCSGKIYQDFEFSKPKWIKFCENGCWKIKCFRKKSNLICKFCNCPVKFRTNV